MKELGNEFGAFQVQPNAIMSKLHATGEGNPNAAVGGSLIMLLTLRLVNRRWGFRSSQTPEETKVHLAIINFKGRTLLISILILLGEGNGYSIRYLSSSFGG